MAVLCSSPRASPLPKASCIRSLHSHACMHADGLTFALACTHAQLCRRLTSICRKALDIRFAVLLMRSTYDAVDDLDFIPMVRELHWGWDGASTVPEHGPTFLGPNQHYQPGPLLLSLLLLLPQNDFQVAFWK